MMRSITRPEHVKAKLAPVIEVLRNIDGEALMYDPEMFEHAAGLLLWCEATVAQIDAPAETEDAQADPMRELATAVGLRALTITMLVDAENRLGLSVLDQYERDLADLKFSGATIGQIRALEADTKARAEAHRLNIIDLTAKKNLLEEFLKTHDLSLLANTEFELSAAEVA